MTVTAPDTGYGGYTDRFIKPRQHPVEFRGPYSRHHPARSAQRERGPCASVGELNSANRALCTTGVVAGFGTGRLRPGSGGDIITLYIENTGAVDTTYAAEKFAVTDSGGNVIYQDTVSGSIFSGRKEDSCSHTGPAANSKRTRVPQRDSKRHEDREAVIPFPNRWPSAALKQAFLP